MAPDKLMSCMMLSKKHYQYIADSLYRIHSQFNSRIEFHATRTKFGDNCETQESGILMLVNKLMNWNVSAYNFMYSERHGPICRERPIESCKPLHNDIDAMQLYKAIQAIDYQCIDDPNYEKSPEKILVTLILRDCINFIVDSSEAYKSAKWCID